METPLTPASAAQPLPKLIQGVPLCTLAALIYSQRRQESSSANSTLFDMWVTAAFSCSLSTITFHPKNVIAGRLFEHLAAFFLAMAFSSVVSAALDSRLYGWLVVALCLAVTMSPLLKDVLQWLRSMFGWVDKILERWSGGVALPAEEEPPLRKLIHDVPLSILAATVALVSSDHRQAITTPKFAIWLTAAFFCSLSTVTLKVASAQRGEHVAAFFLAMTFASVVSATLESAYSSSLVYVACMLPVLPLVNDMIQWVLHKISVWWTWTWRGGEKPPVASSGDDIV